MKRPMRSVALAGFEEVLAWVGDAEGRQSARCGRGRVLGAASYLCGVGIRDPERQDRRSQRSRIKHG